MGEELVDVFFDDFKITHTKSLVIQTNDYYPFGLTFNSYNRENSTPNDYQFNGKELQDELNLGWLDYGARLYMPDIGRWSITDPILERYYSWSPYAYAINNPILFIDPDGMRIQATMEAIMAIYHSLGQGESVKIEVDDDGYVKSEPLKEQAEQSSSQVLKDFYFLASHEKTIEVSVDDKVSYLDEKRQNASYEFGTPYDHNAMEDMYEQNKAELDKAGISKEQYFKQLAEIGFESGTSVQGSLGQTLLPYPQGEGLSSTNDNIQVILNKKGTLNHRAIGVAHEFTHVVLHLKGLPDAHPQADKAIEIRTKEVKQRLGYDH